jgi:hypothetical protein
MSVNQLPGFPTEHELRALTDLYGERAVEEAMIAIARAVDKKGLKIIVKSSPERVRAVLEAIYGRPGVGEVWL